MEIRHYKALSAAEGKPYLPERCNSSNLGAWIFGEGMKEEKMCTFRQDIYRKLPGLLARSHDSMR